MGAPPSSRSIVFLLFLQIVEGNYYHILMPSSFPNYRFGGVFFINAIKKFYGLICKGEQVVAMITLLSGTLVLCIAAISRNLGYPLATTNEIALFLFAWSIFLGADSAYRKNKLVYVEVLIDKLPHNYRRALFLIIYLLTAAFFALFTYEGICLVKHSWVRSWASLPGMSYGWTALSMPIGCTMMFITTVIQFTKYVIKGEKKPMSSEEYIEEEI